MIKSRWRHLAVLFALAFAPVTATGCKKDQSTTGEAAQASASGFAKGFNALIDRPQGMIKRYFDTIPEDGPAADSKPKLFPEQNFATSSLEEAKTAFAEAKRSVPASMKAVPPLADAALAAAEKLVAAYTAAQKYYEAEDYKDDKFAKGKEHHAAMLKARGEFRSAIDALSGALDAVENAQAEADLKKFGKDSYSYWFRAYNMTAKKFLSGVTSASGPASAAKAAADGFAAVDALHAELEAFGKAKGDKAHATFKTYLTMAGTFHSTAKKLQRMASEPPSDQQVSNAVDLLISNYNNLVQMYSTLTQLEGQGLLK